MRAPPPPVWPCPPAGTADKGYWAAVGAILDVQHPRTLGSVPGLPAALAAAHQYPLLQQLLLPPGSDLIGPDLTDLIRQLLKPASAKAAQRAQQGYYAAAAAAAEEAQAAADAARHVADAATARLAAEMSEDEGQEGGGEAMEGGEAGAAGAAAEEGGAQGAATSEPEPEAPQEQQADAQEDEPSGEASGSGSDPWRDAHFAAAVAACCQAAVADLTPAQLCMHPLIALDVDRGARAAKCACNSLLCVCARASCSRPRPARPPPHVAAFLVASVRQLDQGEAMALLHYLSTLLRNHMRFVGGLAQAAQARLPAAVVLPSLQQVLHWLACTIDAKYFALAISAAEVGGRVGAHWLVCRKRGRALGWVRAAGRTRVPTMHISLACPTTCKGDPLGERTVTSGGAAAGGCGAVDGAQGAGGGGGGERRVVGWTWWWRCGGPRARMLLAHG